jgi:hypothetical protein
MQPAQDLAMIRAQSRPDDLACLLVNGVRHDRKRMHI